MKDFMDLEDDIKMTDKEFCYKMQIALRKQDETLYHIREYVKVMADEPDEWIKLREVYHALKRMLGDEI